MAFLSDRGMPTHPPGGRPAPSPPHTNLLVDRSTFSSQAGEPSYFGDFGCAGGWTSRSQFTTVTAAASGRLRRIDLKLARDYGEGLLELRLYASGRQSRIGRAHRSEPLDPASYRHLVFSVMFELADLPADVETPTVFDLARADFTVMKGSVFGFMLRSVSPYPTAKIALLRTSRRDHPGIATYCSPGKAAPYLDETLCHTAQFRTFLD